MKVPRSDSWGYKDDIPYISALVRHLQDNDYGLDETQVFACGHSAGGTFALFLQNELDIFRACAAVSSAVGRLHLWNMSKRGHPAMIIWNHADPILEQYSPAGGEPAYYNLTVSTLRRHGSKLFVSWPLPTSKRIVDAKLLEYPEDTAPQLSVLSFKSNPGTHDWADLSWCTFSATAELLRFFGLMGVVEDEALVASHLALAIGGATLGVLHVLGRLDHLAAIAALSVGGQCQSFRLGLRWGVGHSIGLLVMTLLLVLMGVTLEASELFCEAIVGIMMMLLGGISALRTWRAASPHESPGARLKLGNVERSNDDQPSSMNSGARDLVTLIGQSQDQDAVPAPCSGQSTSSTAGGAEEAGEDGRTVTETTTKAGKLQKCMFNPVNALCIGFGHGIAGPSRVLGVGVMQNTVLHSWTKSSMYFGCFFISSALIMGMIAAAYGACTSRCAGNSWRIRRRLSLLSAGMACLVGLLWLVLLPLQISLRCR
eukprot:gnl/MRDRNA2_/MRDRNA2_76789_c1_seq2.p1 gnl/MRDRNA2_/MRDRNA2_76789_c1~~gnl/MRDRNA2_/MRDRNA2_76789_c1_seq2.p1  ORF type:complete len:560 (-),score=74.15 gnl/MRDRNA2_/MRDRNA2_76789_c1_seq2:233-1687(-)